MLFVLCRRHLGFNWSLAVTLIFLTTPAVIYGGGSGQVETRIALFVMVAAWGTARALAMAEAVWSPSEHKEWGGFLRRVRVHEGRLRAQNVTFRAVDGEPAGGAGKAEL